MQGIKLSVNYVGARLDIALITISGYVDTTTCQELAKLIESLVKQKHYLIIADLGGVTYVSSAGWGVFMGEIKNIRDRGGDLKIVQMTPEVYEVFEMLEFNRILNYYESIEEAIDEFDIIRGIDITKVDDAVREMAENAAVNPTLLKTPMPVNIPRRNKGGKSGEGTLPLKDFPLMEKIKMVILENPFLGIQGIGKQLNTKKYGFVKIGWFRMRSILKKLNLETKQKRHRFYRAR